MRKINAGIEEDKRTSLKRNFALNDEELKRLFEKGLSDREIGKLFGINANIIFRHRQSLGLSRCKRWEKTASNIEKFKQLYSEGLHDRKIGSILGICIDTARKIRHELGLPPQALSRKHVDTEKLKLYMTLGLNDKEIGSIFGISAYTVYERRREVGLFRRKKQIVFENINLNDFKRLYREGMSDTAIAKTLEVNNPELIREIRRYLGFAPNKGRFHEKQRELYEAGMSDGQIAKIIIRSKKSVAAWRRNHGLPPNKLYVSQNTELDAEFLKTEENKITQKNPKFFNRNMKFFESFVRKVIKNKEKVTRYALKRTEDDELKQLFYRGFSDVEIGKHFGVSERTISYRRRSLGLYRQKSRQSDRRVNDIEGSKQQYFRGMDNIKIGKSISNPHSAVYGIFHHLGHLTNDSESLFNDIEFLENFVEKKIKKGI